MMGAMAHSHLASTLVRFEASIHRTKNRLVSIPAAIQRQLGLTRQADNHLLLISIRKRGHGRWNHHYVKLTYDNEFALPADVLHLQPGDAVEVKIHRVIADTPYTPRPEAEGAGVLMALARHPRPGWRADGSTRVDDYLNEKARG
jgi:hypothetical protein